MFAASHFNAEDNVDQCLINSGNVSNPTVRQAISSGREPVVRDIRNTQEKCRQRPRKQI